MSSIWTDDERIETTGGQVGFLILHSHTLTGRESYSLRLRPARTNQSHEDRLEGWCGTDNDVATHARGLARVSRVAANGRVRLQRVEPTPELLEELGYPELADD